MIAKRVSTCVAKCFLLTLMTGSAGAVPGRILGKDSEGTVLGAVAGGAIGTGIAARNRGEEVTLPEGIAVEINLDAPFEG